MVTRHPLERLASTYRYAVRANTTKWDYPPISGMVREEQDNWETRVVIQEALEVRDPISRTGFLDR